MLEVPVRVSEPNAEKTWQLNLRAYSFFCVVQPCSHGQVTWTLKVSSANDTRLAGLNSGDGSALHDGMSARLQALRVVGSGARVGRRHGRRVRRLQPAQLRAVARVMGRRVEALQRRPVSAKKAASPLV